MAMTPTERTRGFTLPYVPACGATAFVNGVSFGARYELVTTVLVGPSDLDALRNGPIVLGDDAAARFRDVLAQGRRPLAAPPASRSDALPAG